MHEAKFFSGSTSKQIPKVWTYRHLFKSKISIFCVKKCQLATLLLFALPLYYEAAKQPFVFLLLLLLLLLLSLCSFKGTFELPSPPFIQAQPLAKLRRRRGRKKYCMHVRNIPRGRVGGGRGDWRRQRRGPRLESSLLSLMQLSFMSCSVKSGGKLNSFFLTVQMCERFSTTTFFRTCFFFFLLSPSQYTLLCHFTMAAATAPDNLHWAIVCSSSSSSSNSSSSSRTQKGVDSESKILILRLERILSVLYCTHSVHKRIILQLNLLN